MSTINYMITHSVLRTMGGPAQASNWLRVFMVPGMGVIAAAAMDRAFHGRDRNSKPRD